MVCFRLSKSLVCIASLSQFWSAVACSSCDNTNTLNDNVLELIALPANSHKVVYHQIVVSQSAVHIEIRDKVCLSSFAKIVRERAQTDCLYMSQTESTGVRCDHSRRPLRACHCWQVYTVIGGWKRIKTQVGVNVDYHTLCTESCVDDHVCAFMESCVELSQAVSASKLNLRGVKALRFTHLGNLYHTTLYRVNMQLHHLCTQWYCSCPGCVAAAACLALSSFH